jgi:hypothetical protein
VYVELEWRAVVAPFGSSSRNGEWNANQQVGPRIRTQRKRGPTLTNPTTRRSALIPPASAYVPIWVGTSSLMYPASLLGVRFQASPKEVP